MLYKQLIELFDILDSASASGAQVVEYLRSIVPDCQVETYPLEGPKGHTDMVRILIPGKNGKSKGGSAKTMGILGRLGGLGARPEQLGFVSDGDGALTALAVAAKLLDMQKEAFHGLCFVNLVDFDMLYGHRNDIDGYAKSAAEFDQALGEFMGQMHKEDILMITADHGCDPGFPGTDHTREHTPFLVYGKSIREDVNLGTRESFADIAATILDIFNVENNTDGTSMKEYILKK